MLSTYYLGLGLRREPPNASRGRVQQVKEIAGAYCGLTQCGADGHLAAWTKLTAETTQPLVEKCRPDNVRYSSHRHVNSHVYDIGCADAHHNLCTITKVLFKRLIKGAREMAQ